MKNAIRASKIFPGTFRHTPNDAATPGHQLLLRAGYIRQVNSGVFILAPLAMRVLWKIETIVREEMNAIDGLEVNLPILQPAELWKKTGRWERYVKDGIMFSGKDRHKQEFGLAPTAEEVVTEFAQWDIQSYGQLPLTLWQMDWKFRDEFRPRMGLIRSRMFRMKDSYSFDTDENGMRYSYDQHRQAYQNIFRRLGFNFISVQADSGAIGGKGSAEFMATSEFGEDMLLTCTACDYGANQEKAESIIPAHIYDQELRPMRKEDTPNIRTVEELGRYFNLSPKNMVKTIIYVADNKAIAVCCRGDLQINEIKLKNMLGAANLEIATEGTVREITGAPVGFAGPINLERASRIIFDVSVRGMTNILCGCNEEDVHMLDVNLGRNIPLPDQFYDVHSAEAGHKCPSCEGILKESKGIEIGHIFMLQKGYAEKMGVTFSGADGTNHTPWMGCYGIGTTRCLQALVEQHNDESGIKWPTQVAPFRFVIVPTTTTANSPQTALAEKLFLTMEKAGKEVVLDDREATFGSKMKDALLIGYPIIIVVGRGAPEGQIEVQFRSNNKREPMDINSLLNL